MFLFQVAEQNRNLAADNMIKSTAPNASELCTGKLNFSQVMRQASSYSPSEAFQKKDNILSHATDTVAVSKSVKQAALDFSQAVVFDSAMRRLLEHSFKQQPNKIVTDFRPS